MMPSILARSRTMRSGPARSAGRRGSRRSSWSAGLRACTGYSLHTLCMGHDTYGDEDYGPGGHGQPEDHDRGQPEAYWRRRVIALGAGLALLALLAWAFSGGGKAPAAAPEDSQGGSASAWPAAAYSGPPAAAGSPASLSPRASGSASSASVG